MAVTPLQRDICRLLADRRRASGESYVAGGVALNVALEAHRVSRDLDVFHDTIEAVARSSDGDRALLEASGYTVVVLRERPGYVEATVSRGDATVAVEWARDSAFRFFPLVEHPLLGLTLHPFDLATNKVLALVGRLEARDWIDVLTCHERLQPLGYLVWAASGKDPGYSPAALLSHAARTARYTEAEVSALSFDGLPPKAGDLSRLWHAAIDVARNIVRALPADHVGEAVLSNEGLFVGDANALARGLADDRVQFHCGRIGGAFPSVAPR